MHGTLKKNCWRSEKKTKGVCYIRHFSSNHKTTTENVSARAHIYTSSLTGSPACKVRTSKGAFGRPPADGKNKSAVPCFGCTWSFHQWWLTPHRHKALQFSSFFFPSKMLPSTKTLENVMRKTFNREEETWKVHRTENTSEAFSSLAWTLLPNIYKSNDPTIKCQTSSGCAGSLSLLLGCGPVGPKSRNAVAPPDPTGMSFKYTKRVATRCPPCRTDEDTKRSEAR